MASSAARGHNRHGSVPAPARRLFPRSLHTASVSPGKLSVLFVSPYPICPPTHGGGVFMYQTRPNWHGSRTFHLIVLLDFEHQRAPHDELASQCASAEFIVRMTDARTHSVRSTPMQSAEFSNPRSRMADSPADPAKRHRRTSTGISAAWPVRGESSAKFRASCLSTISTSSRLRASCPA